MARGRYQKSNANASSANKNDTHKKFAPYMVCEVCSAGAEDLSFVEPGLTDQELFGSTRYRTFKSCCAGKVYYQESMKNQAWH